MIRMLYASAMLIAVLTATPCHAGNDEASTVGRVEHLKGMASIVTPDGRVIVLKEDALITHGARIRTSPGGRLDVRLQDGSLYFQGELADVTIDETIVSGDPKQRSRTWGRKIIDFLRKVAHLVGALNPDKLYVS